jgi:GTP-binding protein
MFVDEVTIRVKAGNGGHGCASFRRERFVPRGGPDGGDGGRGGDVVIRASENNASLEALRYLDHYHAENGVGGAGKGLHGRRGADVVILVPVGTIVRRAGTDHEVADLDHHDAEVTVARGGGGGRGNRHFATSVNRAPRQCEPGQETEERYFDLELKLIAQVGLVGYPNAGKSTLLGALTGAEAEVGAYPFTTLTPNVGTLEYPDFHRLTLADIPGLIEGAHENRGLGHHFLRHIERTSTLLYVLDLGGADGISAEGALAALQQELEAYHVGLTERPAIIAANKTDEDPDGAALAALRAATKLAVYPVCAVLEEGVPELAAALRELAASA